MKLNDTVELVLKRKGFQVHSTEPDATVYEALQKMSDEDIGALVVIDGTECRWGLFRARLRAQGGSQGPIVEGAEGPRDHVQPRRHGNAEDHH